MGKVDYRPKADVPNKLLVADRAFAGKKRRTDRPAANRPALARTAACISLLFSKPSLS